MKIDLSAKTYIQTKDPSLGLTTTNKPYIGFCYPKTKEQIQHEKNSITMDVSITAHEKKTLLKRIKNYYNCYITLDKEDNIKILTENDEEYKDQNFRFKLRPNDTTISINGLKKYLTLKNFKTPTSKSLYERIVNELKKYCYLKLEEQYDLIAVYIMLTYKYTYLDFMPILHLNGEAGTGKSQLGKTITKMAFNSSSTVSTTSSSFFRRIDRKRGLYFMDEKEKLEEYEKELLNGCTYEGNIHTVTEKINDEFIDTDFHIYTPIVLACINEIYGATSTRTIKIETVKPPRNVKQYGIMRLTDNKEEWESIRDDLVIWALKTYKENSDLMIIDDDLRKILNNRGMDTWKGILNQSKKCGVYTKIKNYITDYYDEQIEEMSSSDLNFMFIKYLYTLGDKTNIKAQSLLSEFTSLYLSDKQKEHFNITRLGRLMRRLGYDNKSGLKKRTGQGYEYTLIKEKTTCFLKNNYDYLEITDKIDEIITEEKIKVS